MTAGFENLLQVVFFATFGLLVVLERLPPARRSGVPTVGRWPSNLALLALAALTTTAVVPAGLYVFAQQHPPGLVAALQLPKALEIIVSFLVLDLWRYWEHRLLHRIPILWRTHLVHHSDTQLDVTTTERHHPVGVLLSLMTMLILVIALGLPAEALGVYLLVAAVVSLLANANLRPVPFLDGALRSLVVTPSFHAVHHSSLRRETGSNYATVLTIWDRLFGTYTDPSRASILYFGLEYFHLPRGTKLGRVLLQPFLYRRATVYPQRVAVVPSDAAIDHTVPLSREWRSALYICL